MDKNKRKVLNHYHVIFLIQNVIAGTTMLSLPNKLSSMGYSQWWMPLLFGVVANLALIPIVWLGLKYKNDTLYDIHEKLLGKFLGKTINVILIMYFIVIISAVCSSYMKLIQVVALTDQSMAGPLFLLIILTIYIVTGGIKSIARFCVLSFFLTLGVIYFLKWGITGGSLSHILPVFNFTTEEFITATKNGLMTIGGFELLSFYFPFIINQKKAFKHATVGIWLSVSMVFIIVFVSVLFFSEWQLKNLLYPVLNLFKEAQLSFLERIDVLAITLWVFLILTTIAAYMWVTKIGIESVRSKTNKYYLYIIGAIVFFIVQFPYLEKFQNLLFERVFYMMYALFLWPVLLCMLHLLKTKKTRE